MKIRFQSRLEEINKGSLLELMKQRNFDVRLKHDLESSIISVYHKDQIDHLDKSIDYLNKEIDKIVESKK